MTQNYECDQNNLWCLVPKQHDRPPTLTPCVLQTSWLTKEDLQHCRFGPQDQSQSLETQYLFMFRFWINQCNSITPPKFNMEPENDGCQVRFISLVTHFQIPC